MEEYSNVYQSKAKLIDKETAIWLSLAGGLGIQKTNYFRTGDLKVMLVDDKISKKIKVAQKGLGIDGLIKLNIPTYVDMYLWLLRNNKTSFFPNSDSDPEEQIIQYITNLVKTTDPYTI